MRIVRVLWIPAAILLLLMAAQPGLAQSAPRVTDLDVEYTFGEQIAFRGSVESGLPVQEVRVFLQWPGLPNALSGLAALDASGLAVYEHDTRAQSVPGFTDVTYWFAVTVEGGQVFTSEPAMFFYEDNRFDWRLLESPPFQVHWYAGDVTFAQLVLDNAHQGMMRSAAILGAGEPDLVDIYAYDNLEDYRSAKDILGPLWAGGHADPAAGVIVVALPGGGEQRLEVERKIPHEVAHIVLYQAAGSGYVNIPTWLNEGFASRIEVNPNPDYHFLLQNALESDALLPISNLCPSFPRDASGAVLSYAESTSFVRYLEQTYGPAGVRALVRSYADGAGCQEGPRVAPFNKSLGQLEREWRNATFAQNPIRSTLEALLPWLVLGGAVLAGPLIAFLSGLAHKRRSAGPVPAAGSK